MSLSYYTNSQDMINNFFYLPPTVPPPPPPQNDLQTDLLCCMNDNFDSCFPELTYNVDVDQNLFDPNDCFNFDQNYNNNEPLLPFPIEAEVETPFSLQQQQVFNSPFINLPKRQKHDYDCFQNNIYSDPYKPPLLFNGSTDCYNLNSMDMPNFLPDFDFASLPQVFNMGSVNENENEKVKKQSLSAQSIAARQRRRKITEKTQELGKLIPGGGKLNTAEMLQSAYKYIKYLQAQVGIFQFMDNSQEKCEEFNELVESSLVQEKLYSNDKCLVPKKFVEELISDDDNKFEFKAQVLKEIRQLIQDD